MFDFQFDSFSDFLAMGGYGTFVWFSYLAFFAVVIWNYWQPRHERKRVVRLLRARMARDQQDGNRNEQDPLKQQMTQQQQGDQPTPVRQFE